MWIDINSNEIVTAEQLRKEYEENRALYPDEFNYSFEDYIHNCKAENNGSLVDYEIPFC